MLGQRRRPDEILVVDDGSSDQTPSILDSYKPQVTVIRRANGGVASARNALCSRAQGDLLAFLDADDLWHPKYLEIQEGLFEKHPDAVASYTEHVNFHGAADYQWKADTGDSPSRIELIPALDFFKRYNQATGPFASMSYCCVSRKALLQIGGEPFRVDGVDDSYLCYQLALVGPVVYAAMPLAAYRITAGAQSANHLKTFGLWVRVFDLLSDRYEKSADKNLLGAFELAFASKRRSYSKILMGVGRVEEARRQLSSSLRNSSNVVSRAKSLGLLGLSYLPRPLQPAWPPAERAVEIPEGAQRA